MKYLFDDWEQIAEIVCGSTGILLLLDYDGTTVPIQSSPEQARLDEETRKLLHEMSCIPKVALGIISGRSINDIHAMVGLDELAYAGNHGLEILLPGKPVKRFYTQADLELIRKVQAELRGPLSKISGVRIEEKGPIIALHYRTAPPGTRERLLKIARDVVSTYPGLCMRQGKMVIEITPDKPFNKGEAVRWFLDNLYPSKRPVVVFAGDDLTDEDVFAILGQDDVSIYVGPEPNHFSARYFIKDSTETREFLHRLHRLMMSS